MVRSSVEEISLFGTFVPITKVALNRTMTVLKWARIALKPSKPRSAIVKSRKVQHVKSFCVKDSIIPGHHNKSNKNVGDNV